MIRRWAGIIFAVFWCAPAIAQDTAEKIVSVTIRGTGFKSLLIIPVDEFDQLPGPKSKRLASLDLSDYERDHERDVDLEAGTRYYFIAICPNRPRKLGLPQHIVRSGWVTVRCR